MEKKRKKLPEPGPDHEAPAQKNKKRRFFEGSDESVPKKKPATAPSVAKLPQKPREVSQNWKLLAKVRERPPLLLRTGNTGRFQRAVGL
jgi:hypothetical protein